MRSLAKIWAISVLSFSFSSCQSTPPPTETSIKGQLEIARQFIESGNYPRAASVLQSLRKDFPKDFDVEMSLGIACMGLGDYPSAAAAFERASHIDKKSGDALLNYGYALTVQKKFNDARNVFESIYKLDYPYMEKVHVNYGLTYLEERRCDLAQKKFSEALALDPTFVSAHFNIGKCFVSQHKYTLAVQSFKKAVDFCPGCIDPTLELARAFYLSGQKRAAVDSLEKLLNNKMDNNSEAKTRRMLKEFKR